MTLPTGFTFDAFIDVLAERVVAKMEARQRFVIGASSKRLLTTEAAAEFLGRSKEAMQHLAASGKIPTVRSDRRVFFDIHDLERWIEQNKGAGVN
jgi:excisionase family DNA binding protein